MPSCARCNKKYKKKCSCTDGLGEKATESSPADKMVAPQKPILDFPSITSSASFKIMVGPDRHEHSMHSALLASQSPVLRALVNNGMQESTERLSEWAHVAEHTFGYFSEFAYTRDFHVVEPKDGGEGRDVAEAASPENDATITSWLIHHAEVMIFAEYYAVDDLLVLAHSKLELALASLPINDPEQRSSQAVGAVSDLCRFSYSRQVPVLVRDLVVSFLKKHPSRLWRDDTFQMVVKESPALALDLLGCVIHQIPKEHHNVRITCSDCGYGGVTPKCSCCGGRLVRG